jgi:hypothetical protein
VIQTLAPILMIALGALVLLALELARRAGVRQEAERAQQEDQKRATRIIDAAGAARVRVDGRSADDRLRQRGRLRD